ncbi:MAG: transporter [Bacteroidaceae bacterium]|nr:transporter [Bacteroidaceae bacterium]
MRILTFIKNWTLPISMTLGVVGYFVYVSIHSLDHTHAFMNDFIGFLQPALIFCMLFLSFCKVKPTELKPHRWQLKLLAIQTLSFVGMALPVICWPDMPGRVFIESAMVCMICPTATAAAVVTTKLHGNSSYVISYTCVINLAAAILIPLVVSSLPDGAEGMDFVTSFTMIIGRVFPLLMMPLFLAFIVRYLSPRLHAWFVSVSGWAFYMWAVALMLAIGITTKAIVHSNISIIDFILIAVISAATCVLQFYLGRLIGRHHGDKIAGAQSLGQKNTAFAIWMAYTFMNPVTALAGGFYAVWHNIVNSYQLWKERQ